LFTSLPSRQRLPISINGIDDEILEIEQLRFLLTGPLNYFKQLFDIIFRRVYLDSVKAWHKEDFTSEL
jgi:hypothetical protein